MVEDFNRLLKEENLEEAFNLLIQTISYHGLSEELIHISKRLSTELRRKAQILALKKDDKGAIQLEKYLKEVIKINGEGFYT